ncbi:disease resistance protein (TIR-NBS-LRR class) [Trifolium pratense]|uniref:Disease resistance protein (TIR-NBS-LRR class) n=1 Tax=Trifolium pratense TaxID=57577 RepID=A0A2K3M4Y4_TRIPR|nr:disease resistance protein (TIR-NBS-LRR class) [Trifolium pratense]
MPDSIGNLESLTELLAYNSGIKELPSTIGSLSYLRKLSVGKCKLLSKLPDSFKTIASITELDLDGTSIRYLPDEIGEMKQLRKLEIGNCSNLESLPESIGHLASLTTLNIINGNIRELPASIGLLDNLMAETAMKDLPESFGMLSSLRTLRMAKRPHLVPISVENTGSFVLPSSFCNLTLLYDLPSSLEGLSFLKKLSLPNCTELISLPSLPSSLIELNADNCYALETIHDVSNLESLEELKLTNCDKVVDITGLECLKSLKRLYLSGCNACSSKVALRNFQNLSMPGTKLPEWFSAGTGMMIMREKKNR